MSENFNLEAMLDMSTQEIKSQIIRGGGGGKRSAWGNLNEQQVALIHKKILVNLKVASDFAAGKTDSAQFFVISDVPTNEKTAVIHRNQPVTFQKSGEIVKDVVVGFLQTGTNTKLSYKDGENDIVFRASGMSVETLSNGSKSIDNCSFGEITEEAPAKKK